MGTTVFATGEGSLTVKNSENGVTYNFYKIFDLTGQDTTNPADNIYDAVVYTIDSDWTAFFNGAGSAYISTTNTGNALNPIKIDGVTKYINITESNKVDFTNAAMKYALENTPALTPDKTATGVASGDVSVSGLDLGYYLMIPVDQTNEKVNGENTTGTIASLTSTIPSADIYVKATGPSIEKVDDTVSADVGQTVTYTLTGQVPNTSGTSSFVYKLYDTMSTGLTFLNDVVITIDTTAVDASIASNWIDYTPANGFIVTVPVNNYQDKVGKDIVLTYHAIVNDSAVTNTEKNHAELEYGRTPGSLKKTTPIEEEVYSAKIIINKYYDNNPSDATKKLSGAKFALMKIDSGTAKYYKYTAASQTSPAKVEWVDVAGAPTNGTDAVTDAMATVLKNATTITTKETGNDGSATFPGLADGTYYLVEYEAPEGYNRLDTPQAVTVTGKNADAKASDGTTAQTTTVDGTDSLGYVENKANAGQTLFDVPVDGVADVNNAHGGVLPSTGGMGTTIFYIIGVILLAGAAIVLVTRRRMNAE